ncbi:MULTISPECIES: YerC/YecD family TrpR-related protein [Acidaminococcus]|jgi:TrpR-related protein YerC/YecD|uniref:YerC/YecD family TrpR-related protein n=1 Tax=Acidaminococcus TaxID=904 RepID=UPI00210266E3|nr:MULTISPECIES: YerC/YecD family TrpR-related protein [Acidaminococcus]
MIIQAGYNKKELLQLADAFLTLENKEMCLAFLEDICTPNELKALGQRLEVAVRLHRGENYAKIVKDTGASSTTVSRVNRCLNYGAGGYQTVIPRITKGEENA